ncbi:hypothetical protein H9L12_03820 [Sphingomonas rhizophila]|uniref:Uncharacterized protein n=1 Tax=Sphingomonas rhizophila TaxID=2071607 RepID=A0A7G9SCX5_9SPHN|nr:DUF6356 family protein [Sphingomonas rhizophila]QNN65700.1 hypothetical protein H9L12_03820 [Sphingomonas rhizophila]
MAFAATVGLLTLSAGLACLIHALIPALCTRTASRTIRLLYRLMDERGELQSVREQSVDVVAFAVLILLAGAVTLPLWILDVPQPLAIAYTLLAFAIPAAHLLSNRELDRLEPARA